MTFRGEPFWICYDHDDDCRKAIGSPLNLWVGYHPEQVTLEKGIPKSFSRTQGVVRTFCPDCGTSIGYTDEGLPNEVYFTIGFLDAPDLFAPQAHAYWRMKLPWVQFCDHLPHIEEFSRERSEKWGNPSQR